MRAWVNVWVSGWLDGCASVCEREWQWVWWEAVVMVKVSLMTLQCPAVRHTSTVIEPTGYWWAWLLGGMFSWIKKVLPHMSSLSQEWACRGERLAHAG